jgi:tRNA G18 (ribose-2'-O)-methylase SpoU
MEMMEKISKAQVKFVRSLQLKKVRDAEGLFVAEGEKCVEELRRGYELVYYIQTAEKPQAGPRTQTVIIMGNEGNGISAEVRKFITDPIYIPTYPNKETSDVVESLNVSIATAIVVAEFRRPTQPYHEGKER